MIDRAFIGTKRPPFTTTVERGQLRFFAKATGETNAIYSDLAAARAAGHPDLPAPPTFVFSLNLARPDPFAHLTQMGVRLQQILHGEQTFNYLAPIHAGDEITLETELTDIIDKKGGALQLLVERTRARNQHGMLVVDMTATIAVRH